MELQNGIVEAGTGNPSVKSLLKLCHLDTTAEPETTVAAPASAPAGDVRTAATTSQAASDIAAEVEAEGRTSATAAELVTPSASDVVVSLEASGDDGVVAVVVHLS